MKLERVAVSAGLLVVISACAEQTPPASPESSDVAEQEQVEAQPRRQAQAKIQSATGTKLAGDARLVEDDGAVVIVVDVEDAPPGPKGIHIHERGDCSDPKGKSMGEHFAPNHARHGFPHEGERHLGDLGNITIGPDGKGHLEIKVMKASLEPGGPTSFVGKAIIVHEAEDTGTQPSGGAGDPIACGRIDPK